jgi:hypothetical protein
MEIPGSRDYINQSGTFETEIFVMPMYGQECAQMLRSRRLFTDFKTVFEEFD